MDIQELQMFHLSCLVFLHILPEKKIMKGTSNMPAFERAKQWKQLVGRCSIPLFLRPLHQEGAQSGKPVALSLKIGTLLAKKW